MIGFQPKNKRAASAEGAQAPKLGFPGKGPQSAGQAQALNQAPDTIPGMFKPGEFVLPPDTVHAMGGKEALGQVVQATHTPAPAAAVVPRGFKPQAFFAQGGAPEDQPRKNSFGDAAAAAADPSVTQVKTASAPAPKPVQAPAQSAGAQMATPPSSPAEKPVSPTNTFPQTSPSAGANVYAGAGPGTLGSSGQLASVPDGIGGQPGRQPTRPNSFGDAAAATNNPGVTQIAQPQRTESERQALIGQIPSTNRPAPAVSAAPAPSAPVATPAAQGFPPRAPGASELYMQDRAQELRAQVGAGNYAQAAGTAARTGVQGLGMYGIEMADKLSTPVANVAAGFGRGLLGSGAQAAPSTPAGGSSPYANVTPEQGRAMTEIHAKAQSPEAAAASTAAPSAAQQLTQQPGGYDPNQSRPDLGYGPIGDRTKLTNEQAATMNPAGRITATRGANGTMEFSGGNVSGQVSYNDASGKALPGGGLKGKGFSGFDVAPAGANVATGPNGSYAFSTTPSANVPSSGAASRGGATASSLSSNASVSADNQAWHERGRALSQQAGAGSAGDQYAAEVRQAQAINQGQAAQRGSWENRVAQWNDPFSGIGKARRNMETSMAAATTSSNKGMRGAGEKIAAARLAAYGELSKQHFGMAGGDRDDATRRHTSDNSLRGAQMQEAGQNQRADLGFRTAQQRAAIEGRRADSEITALGFKTREAQQYEQLRNQIAQEPDGVKRQSIVQRMREMQGQTQQADKNLSHNFMTRKVQVLDEKGRPTGMEQQEIVDLRTGAAVGQGGAAAQALRANPERAAEFDAKYGPGSARAVLGG